EQSRVLAQYLDKSRHVYYGYAVMDSLSSSYSMFKYFFDLSLAGSTDDMHDFMLTPAGIAAIAAESIFMVSFSFLACHFDGEEEDNYKKWIASAWPYFRDVMKGLKNAYKGWRSALMALTLMGGMDVKFLILPVGLVLGVFAAANRFLLRFLVEERKIQMRINNELLLELIKLPSLTHEESKLYLEGKKLEKNNIQYQTLQYRALAFTGVAVGGFIDGLYLYMGALTLTALAPQLMLAMALVCAFYTVACVITRIYEEYDFQMRLFITQTKCKLVLITKELETSYARLLLLEAKTDKNVNDYLQISHLKDSLHQLIGRFELKRQLLQQQTSRSYLAAVLLGIKNGLYAYSALSSITFLVSAVLLLAGVAFPPSLIIISVFLGLVFLAGFVVHSLVNNYQHHSAQKDPKERPYYKIIEMKEHLAAKEKQAPLIAAKEFHELVNEGLVINPAPQTFFQEWFEIYRSLFSGLGKGQKFVDFAGNPLQETGDDGHYHDSPVMFALGAVSALFFGLFLSLRALARGLGRPPLGQVALASDIVIQPKIITEESNKEQVEVKEQKPVVLETGDYRESSRVVKTQKDSLKRSDSL
ncbi:MAG: hypothetical protein PSV35_03960, partial [bacterium]|nr:hypothetical protein [bacterium]